MLKTKEIHNRIVAIQATQQITKALKIISTTKLGKVKKKVKNVLPYITDFVQIFEQIAFTTKKNPLLLQPKKKDKILLVFFTSNRGFCGGFNKQVCQHIKQLYHYYHLQKKEVTLLPLGAKGRIYLEKQGLPYINKQLNLTNIPSLIQVHSLTKFLLKNFNNNTYNHILLIHQANTQGLEQSIINHQLLPLQTALQPQKPTTIDHIYEPSKKAIIQSMLPNIIALQLYKHTLKALEAEHTARNKAMTQATDNADALLEELHLSYHRLRQTAITRQIIEITASAEVLKTR